MHSSYDYKPGELRVVTTVLGCDEISPRDLLPGDVIMILKATSSTYGDVLFEDKIVQFHCESLANFTKELVEEEHK